VKIREELVFLILGFYGLLVGFIPIYDVNGCHVSLTNYCQSTIPVYIDIFEKLRLAYIPLFFTSVILLVISFPALFSKKYALHPDIKFMMILSFIFAQIPVLSAINIVRSMSFTTTISDVIISVSLNVEKLPSFYLLSIHGVSPLLIVSIIVLAYYLVHLVTRVDIIDI